MNSPRKPTDPRAVPSVTKRRHKPEQIAAMAQEFCHFGDFECDVAYELEDFPCSQPVVIWYFCIGGGWLDADLVLTRECIDAFRAEIMEVLRNSERVRQVEAFDEPEEAY